MNACIRAFRTSRSGNAAIEFALLVPVMLTIFAGLYEFGRAFQAYGAVNRLATRYAIAYSDCSDYPQGTCNTELSLYNTQAAIKNLVPQLTNFVTLAMFEVQTDSSGTLSVRYPIGGSLSAAQITAAQTVMTAPNLFGVVVTVSYTHTVDLFPQTMTRFLGASIPISYTVAQLNK